MYFVLWFKAARILLFLPLVFLDCLLSAELLVRNGCSSLAEVWKWNHCRPQWPFYRFRRSQSTLSVAWCCWRHDHMLANISSYRWLSFLGERTPCSTVSLQLQHGQNLVLTYVSVIVSNKTYSVLRESRSSIILTVLKDHGRQYVLLICHCQTGCYNK